MYMSRPLVAEQREWKENSYHYLQEEILLFSLFILINFNLTGQEKRPHFYILVLKKWEFYISSYDQCT